jgi:hypothetical protein
MTNGQYDLVNAVALKKLKLMPKEGMAGNFNQ